MPPAHAIDATLTPIGREVGKPRYKRAHFALLKIAAAPGNSAAPLYLTTAHCHRMPPCAACGHQYCGKRYSIRDTHGSQGTCTENHCCRCDGYDGCDVCERYYKCCTCRAAAMPKILKTLPGAWLQQTEKGTAWTLCDDDVAKITGAKGQRKVILRAAAAAGCVVLRETCRRDDARRRERREAHHRRGRFGFSSRAAGRQ